MGVQVGVPKLDGGRVGVFATRSPHRPSPIGLSVAKVKNLKKKPQKKRETAALVAIGWDEGEGQWSEIVRTS